MTIKMILIAFVALFITILGIYVLSILGITCYKSIKKEIKK